jgi:hypothetical protein
MKMIKFLFRGQYMTKFNLNSILIKSFTSHSSTTPTQSKFELKIDEDNLDDEDLEYLKNKHLSVESETDKIKAIKLLVEENHDLKKENGKLKYRIEHLLLTINSLEEELKSKI